ncbi:hypothetical protein [Bradyrhizobium sp. Ai1a-2]|uniref:hypothetical protein n=1 Tax=Bradyrhizobium sp. Ai1a-2 TaxID=196490 RepID=UPI00048224A7|nr:hypothetical protein [Bradyrhizobium sp. Ai1a-2]
MSTALVNIDVLTPEKVFASTGSVEEVICKLENDVRAMEKPGIDTKAARDELASLAYKITRSKTALDDMGKEYVAELKKKAGEVDEKRRLIRSRIDALKEEVRKPLTDWEDAEKARTDAHDEAMAEILGLSEFSVLSESSDAIKQRIARVAALAGRDWEEYADKAAVTIEDAQARLTNALTIATKREDEAAELVRLRAEAAERAQKDREDAIAREAADKARKEAEARNAAAVAEIMRRAEAEKAEANQRAHEATAKLSEALHEQQQTRQRTTAAAGGKASAHRAKINRSAMEAFMKCGIADADAKQVVTLIAQGKIPAVTINY